MKTLVLVPAFNGEKTLTELIPALLRNCAREDILVVDDGSQDGTAQTCARFNINYLSHKKNLGKGAALKTGFNYAREKNYAIIVTIDCDMQHPPECIPAFIEAAQNGADMVIGCRRREKTMPIERRITNFLSSLSLSMLAMKKLPDSQCGFRALKVEMISNMKLFFNRYEVESEMIVEAVRHDAKIAFIPIPTIYNGNRSYFRPIADTARFIRFLFLYYPTRWL